MNATTKSFYVYCTDITQYLYPGAASKTFNMRFTTSYTKIGGCPASPTLINDDFTVTIYNFCGRDKLTALSATSAKQAYVNVTMKVPAILYSHADGRTDNSCPVTYTVEVSINNGVSWLGSADANYLALI